jgi:Domain of unknown function (DU1801)
MASRTAKQLRKPEPQLLDFLSRYDPGIVKLFLALREMVLAEAPAATEMIYHGYTVSVGFSFTGRLKEMYCYVAACKDHVNLGFNRGAELRDPRRLLEGTGTWGRHIKIHEEADLKQPHLREFINLAIDRSLLFRVPRAPEGHVIVKVARRASK